MKTVACIEIQLVGKGNVVAKTTEGVILFTVEVVTLERKGIVDVSNSRGVIFTTTHIFMQLVSYAVLQNVENVDRSAHTFINTLLDGNVLVDTGNTQRGWEPNFEEGCFEEVSNGRMLYRCQGVVRRIRLPGGMGVATSRMSSSGVLLKSSSGGKVEHRGMSHRDRCLLGL